MAAIVKIFPDIRTWVDEAAWEITCVVEAAVEAKGAAFVALSGGHTPVDVYQRLSQSPWRERIPWPHVHWFWVDERWVGAGHAESNYGLAWKALLSKVPVDESKVYRIPTEGLEPSEAATSYETLLRKILGSHGSGLDLAVLGMGTDGHIASLFPDSPLIKEPMRWCAASQSPSGIRQRITMTLKLLNATDTLIFLVRGTDKKKVLETVLHGETLASDYPAGKVVAAKQTIWILDCEAAGFVPSK